MSFQLALLGAPRLQNNGEVVGLNRRKSLALLAYLAVVRRPVRRELLAALLWPDADLPRGLSNVRTAIWSVNRALSDDWAITEGDTLQINVDFQLEVDVRQFRQALAISGEERQSGIKQAVSLYEDDFMAGFSLPDSQEFDDWLFVERENLRQQLSMALEELIVSHSAQGLYDEAIFYARRSLQLDPLNERVHQHLMRLYAWDNQLATVHQQYRMLQTILADELQVPISPETEALYQDILARRLAPPVVQAAATTTVTAPPRSHLPVQGLPFIGRESELKAIHEQFAQPECRLLTLRGPGGTGKTRLAIRAAEKMDWPDGVAFVPLAPLNSAQDVAASMLQALGLYKPQEQNSTDFLCGYLMDKSMLIVLDNYEHLLPDTAIIETVLSQAPRVRLLVTSRERLNLREEWVVDVSGLEYPGSTQDPHWQHSAAVELFTFSARRANHAFTLSEQNGEAVVAICQFVGGLPLGIELAATWTEVLTPADILRELQRGFDILETDASDVPQRQRSVRAVMEYAWMQLRPAERQRMIALSLFVDAFPLEAAREAAGASITDMRRLLNQTLVRHLADGRYHLHELVRQFAWQQATPDEQEAAEQQFFSYYSATVRQLLPRLKSTDQPRAIREMGSMQENLMQAARLIVKYRAWDQLYPITEALWHYFQVYRRMSDIERLVTAVLEALQPQRDLTAEIDILYAFWLVMSAGIRRSTGHQSEVDAISNQVLTILDAHPAHPRTALPLLILAQYYLWPGGHLARFEARTLRALELMRRKRDVWGEAFAEWDYAFALHNGRRYHEVIPHAEAALSLFKQTGQPWGIGIAFDMLAEYAATMGDYTQARLHYEAMLPYIERLDDEIWVINVRREIEQYRHSGMDTEQSITATQQSRESYQRLGDRMSYAWSTYHLAWSYFIRDNLKTAEGYYQEALSIFHEMGSQEGRTWTQVFLASIAQERGRFDEAEQRLKAAVDGVSMDDFPWPLAGAAYVRGDIALSQGDLATAAGHYHQALKIAHDVRSAHQIMRHLSGAADWLLAAGHPEQAEHVAMFILTQPVQDPKLRRRSLRVMQQIDPEFDENVLEEVTPAEETVEAVVDSSLDALAAGAAQRSKP